MTIEFAFFLKLLIFLSDNLILENSNTYSFNIGEYGVPRDFHKVMIVISLVYDNMNIYIANIDNMNIYIANMELTLGSVPQARHPALCSSEERERGVSLCIRRVQDRQM